ncbi:MAG: hypothetical protein IJ733_10305 [Lachnospiraceae bacterium]|nr:hypothetical protein [Lachnospiraceae bacterium]
MRKHDIPEWYIDSCRKIRFLFPRGHCITYAQLYWQLLYYKANSTEDFYQCYFEIYADNEDKEIIAGGMTEKEKADRVAEYIGEISDYEYYDSDWTEIFLKGKGDCMASRYAMEILCRYIDVKAQGCGGLNEHGKTVVKADGKYYIYTTGFNEPRPRSYMVSETTYSYLAEHAKEMGIWMGYFEG